MVGVDISPKMVEIYNRKAADQGLSPDDMRAEVISLDGKMSGLENHSFSIVVCGMAYHHIPSILDVTKSLAHFLKPAGVLVVVDILKSSDDGNIISDSFKHFVPHGAGFDQAEIIEVFTAAGLGSIKFQNLARGKMHGQSTTLFIACGTKTEF